MSKGRTIAFLIAHGPEVRAFLHSSLAAVFQERARVELFVPAGIREMGKLRLGQFGDGLRIWEVPWPVMGGKGVRHVSWWADRLHEAWVWRRWRQERWRHYVPTGRGNSNSPLKSRLVSLLSRSSGVWRALRSMELVLARCDPAVRWWAGALKGAGVDLLVTAGWRGSRTQPALDACRSAGVKSAALSNSWKDVYVKRRLATASDLVGVWDDEAREAVLRFNPTLPAHRVKSVGSLHLAALSSCKVFPDRRSFCKTLNLDPRKPLICYSAASPKAIPDEAQLVLMLVQATMTWPEGERPQVVIRSNPMGGADRFRHITEAHAHVALSEPLWSWDEQNDWCSPLPEDLPLWRAMVEHSALNVSVASTVTLEFALFGKPVINPCFGLASAGPEQSPRRFWEAPFYRWIRAAGVALPARGPQELGELLRSQLGRALPDHVRGRVRGHVADVGAVAEHLLELLRPKRRSPGTFSRRG